MTQVKRIGTHYLDLPCQETFGAAGYDLCYAGDGAITLYPGQRLPLPTGFAWAIPNGMVGLVRPRSGLAVREGLDVLAGVIDADFRGEVKAVLINHGERPVVIDHGERIAQMVVTVYYGAKLEEVFELPDSERGEAGFGSTGAGGFNPRLRTGS